VQLKDGLYILPRHNDVAKKIGSDIWDAIEYICFSGAIYSDTNYLWFESYINRARRDYTDGRFDYDEILGTVNGLDGLHIATSPEEEYISVLLTDVQGSMSFIGENAIIKCDEGCSVDKYEKILNEYGYEIIE